MSDKFSGRVFYVEDEPLIAMETEDALRDLGFEEIDMHHTFDSAMAALDGGSYDLAVMDMNLNGTLSSPLIERLQEKRTPTVVTSGYNTAPELTGVSQIIAIRKPFTSKQLREAIQEALA